jgi:hypothetical protein
MGAIVVAVVLGVVLLPKEKDGERGGPSTGTGSPASPAASPVERMPTNPPSPTSLAPVAGSTVPSAPATREEYLKASAAQWSGVEAFGNPDSAESQALDWLTNTDAMNLGKDASEKDIRQRYTVALLYYATQGQYWATRLRHRSRKLQLLNFLSGDDVCSWNDDGNGILCNAEGFIIELQLGTNRIVLHLHA